MPIFDILKNTRVFVPIISVWDFVFQASEKSMLGKCSKALDLFHWKDILDDPGGKGRMPELVFFLIVVCHL